MIVAVLLQLGNGVEPLRESVRVDVGEISVIAAPTQSGLAVRIGEAGGQVRDWPGLGRHDPGRITIVLAKNAGEYQKWTGNLVPFWSAGVTWPDRRLVVIRLDAADPFETLYHELAHLVLHQQVKKRVPRWFDEGYAVYASGRLGKVADLRLNLAVAMGRIPTLRELDGALLNGPAGLGDAYSLAGSAVAALADLHPEKDLQPFLTQMSAGVNFEQAMMAMGFGPDQFEADWHRLLKRRYNLGGWLIAGGGWLIVTLMLGAGLAWRRHVDRPRREALDQGWTLPADDTEITTFSYSTPKLDPTDLTH